MNPARVFDICLEMRSDFPAAGYLDTSKKKTNKDTEYLAVGSILSTSINNWFMLLAVHYRVMEHAGSLESTKEA